MKKKHIINVGELKVDLSELVPDIRGIEDMTETIVKEDFPESRLRQFDIKLKPFAGFQDLAEWDRVLLERYQPLYLSWQTTCDHCGKGPCDLRRAKGLCGLDLDTYQAKLSLLDACKGAIAQVSRSRDLLNYALKLFGGEKGISLGKSIGYPSNNIAVLTGMNPRNLSELNRALSYAESQILELQASAELAQRDASDLEKKTLHVGSLIFLAMEVEELIKICCFGFSSVGDLELTDYANYPEATTWVGLGSVDTSKPVITFVGNNFLAAWSAANYLRENNLEDKIEVCGIGAVGHDLVRFYPKGRVLTSTAKAVKAIRSGIPDVIVASECCLNLDILDDARRVGSKVIATSSKLNLDLPERTGDSIGDIIDELLRGLPGAIILEPAKAGELAVKLAQKLERKDSYLLTREQIKEYAAECDECDSCFKVCPNNLPISRALRMAQDDFSGLVEIYEKCFFCKRCERACPKGIPIIDLILGASQEEIKQDKFLMRAGRGPLSHLEFRDLTFGLVLGGNGPGIVCLLGCGSYPGSDNELAEMAKEFLERNCVVMTAGCAAADVARHFDEGEGKFIFEQYPSFVGLRGLTNCGGCSAISHILAGVFKLGQLGGGVPTRANYVQSVDYAFQRTPIVVILWGASSDEMYAQAAGFARAGVRVVVGPSGNSFRRYLVGNKYDLEKWWIFDGITGDKREIDPSPPHLIFPVETKEEAIVMTMKLFLMSCDLRESRLSTLDNYTETHEQFFGELPDDWHFYTRSSLELPVKKRMRFLSLLKKEHGWEIDRTMIKRVRHRDGRMMSFDKYVESYGVQQGRYSTMLPRFIIRKGKE